MRCHPYMKFSYVWLLTVLMVATSAPAQELPERLTLEDCFRLALARNPNLKVANLEVDSSHAGLTAQRAQRQPTFSAEWNARVQQSLTRSTSRDLSLVLSQTFYRSGLRESIRTAEVQLEASRYSRQDTERRLLVQVAVAFYDVLGSQAVGEVARAGVAAVRENLELVNARIETGSAATVDRLPVEVELAEAELETLRTMNATWQAMADLRALLALGEGPPPVLSGDMKRVSEPGLLDPWIAEAREQRPDITVQQASARAAELRLTQARIDAGLSLSASGSADYGRHTGITRDNWAVMLSATYPLGNRALRAEVAAAEALREIAYQRLTDLELNIAREVQQSWYRLQDATQRIPAAQLAVEAAQVNLEATRQRYAEGVAIVVEVTDAELSLRRSRLNLVQARYDQIVAHYQLLAAAGRPLLPEQTINE